jgi:threonine dehydrogenase-like Zn-dependent dehydrogenase
MFNGDVRLTDVAKPERGPGEALIHVRLAGICNTDLELAKGYMGFSGILGHEFVGTVTDSNDLSLLGKRVVGEINCPCHRCRYCQLELPNHCLSRSVLGILNRNGAFAEYLTLPVENLHLVPDSIPDETAVFIEPIAAACRILEQVNVEPESKVIVLGDGKLAQLVAQVLRQRTPQVLAIGKYPWKLALMERFGVQTATVHDPVERGADIVVEATGSYEGFNRAIEVVRPEGTIVLKTTVAHPTAFDLSVPVIDELTIIGSRCGPFRMALEMLQDGKVDVGSLISQTYPLSDALNAFERAKANDVMKILIAP